ncbi:MFS general substrate transporter [Xylariaceae sp. FL0594]|nr:MFS general substrate transporter [Xylariaceae sp. FL0594]
MDPTAFRTLVRVESGSLPQAPKKVVARTYAAVPQRDEDDGPSLMSKSAGVSTIPLTPLSLSSPSSSSRVSTPGVERDLERSSVAVIPAKIEDQDEAPSPDPAPGRVSDGPAHAEASQLLRTLNDPPMTKYRFAAVCAQNLLGGLTDSAPGGGGYYNIGYAVVSLIFVGQALGFIAAAPFVDTVRRRLGRARTLGLGDSLMVLGFIPFLCAAPFPVIVVGYFFIGFGFALGLAIGNVYSANLPYGTVWLGGMHGSYGIGGTIGPLIATSIVTTYGPAAWSRYYIITVSMAVLNGAFALWSFWGYEKEVLMSTSLEAVSSQQTGASASASAASPRLLLSAMLQAFKSRVVLLGAVFIFAYQGAEVSISGWVISFLISARGGDPSTVGNVTSGFWGGITLGRFVLSPVGARVGERRFVYGLVVGAAVFQLLVWLVPNVIGEAVSLAVVGLLLGPVYPCAAAVFTRNLSRREQVSGLGVISAFGSSGGAVAPFTTGLLAQAKGTFVLHPVAIGLFAAMLVCWFTLPTTRKRTD